MYVNVCLFCTWLWDVVLTFLGSTVRSAIVTVWTLLIFQTSAVVRLLHLVCRLRSMLTAEETRSTTNVRLSLARQLAETLIHSISDLRYKVLLLCSFLPSAFWL